MGIKTAKDAFSKNDIIEILKQNVVLYRDEPEFVEYIVNLALYLIDQAYCVGGARSAGLESVLEEFRRGKVKTPVPPGFLKDRIPPARAHSQEPPSFGTLPTGEEEIVEEEMVFEAPTKKMKLQDMDPVMKAPPASEVAGDLDEDFDVGSGKIKATDIPASLRASGIDVQVARPDEVAPNQSLPRGDTGRISIGGRTKQLVSGGALTPIPEGGLGNKKPEQKPGEDETTRGRARIYKVVRSYSGQEGKGDTNCPICGTDSRGAARCPSCGHII